MKHFILLMSTVRSINLCNSQTLIGNSFIHLKYINDYRIEIDGGCSFFTFDSVALQSNKYILIISARNIAFVNLEVTNDYTYFNLKSKRVNKKNSQLIFIK